MCSHLWKRWRDTFWCCANLKGWLVNNYCKLTPSCACEESKICVKYPRLKVNFWKRKKYCVNFASKQFLNISNLIVKKLQNKVKIKCRYFKKRFLGIYFLLDSLSKMFQSLNYVVCMCFGPFTFDTNSFLSALSLRKKCLNLLEKRFLGSYD